MKKGLILLLFAALSTSITISAQDNKARKERPTQQQRVEMMTKQMSSKLMLNDAQSAKFAPLYAKYLNDMAALRMPRPEKKEALTDAQRDKMIKEGFASQRKMIDLKEKYYNDFTKFLTPSQAQKIVSPKPDGIDKGKMKKHEGMRDGRMMKKSDKK